MVLYLAAFVATMPEVFEGMLKIRIGYDSFLITDVPIKAVSTLHRKNLKTEILLYKRIKCFPFPFQNTLIIAFFDLSLSKIRVRKCHDYRNNVVSWKASFSTCSLSTLKRKADVVKFLWFEENRFRKAPFSWRSSVSSWSDRGNDAANSNFSGILWTDLKLRAMPLIVYYLISGA